MECSVSMVEVDRTSDKPKQIAVTETVPPVTASQLLQFLSRPSVMSAIIPLLTTATSKCLLQVLVLSVSGSACLYDMFVKTDRETAKQNNFYRNNIKFL